MNQPLNDVDKSQADHISRDPSAKRKYLISALVLIAVIVGLYFVSRFNYPLFHSLADMATVFIAIGVFAVVWNRRHLLDNHFYLFVGIAFLFFAFWDALHLLGNKGMGVFPQYGNLGPTLYIISRYFLGISLLIAPLFIKRKLNTTVAFAAYALVTVLLLLSVFYWRNFPITYVDGVGLTSFKVISDYLICLLLVGATGLLFINRRALDAKVFRFFISALIFFIATGLAFTLYTDPFGVANAIGHFFQITSFYLVYFAFLETIMVRPQDILYRNLNQSRENALKLNTDLENVNIKLKEDITYRTKAEEALKESEEKFNKAFRSSPVAVAITRLSDGTFVDVNDAYERVMGYTRQEVIGRNVTDLNIYIAPEQRDKFVQPIIKNGKVREKEMTFRKKDGQFVDTVVSSEVIRVGGQNLILSTVLDITERKKAEAALKESERKLIGVLESMPDAFVSFDSNLRYTYVNANAERLQVARREDLLGKDVRIIYPDAESYKTISQYEKVVREQKPVTSTSYHAGFDRWIETRAFPTPDGVSVFYKDVSAQVKAEQALRDSEEKYRSLAENVPDIITRYDRNLRHVFVNTAASQASGLPPEAFIGKTNLELGMEPEQVEFWMKHVRNVFATGKPETMEFHWKAPDGLRYQNTIITPEFDNDGSVKTVLCVTHNLTELKRYEESLRKYNSELESANKELESFSYTVSHDLRSPLRSLDGYSAALLEDYADKLDEQGKKWLQNIRVSSLHMGELIEDILGLSRVIRVEMNFEKVNLSEIAKSHSAKLQEIEPKRLVEFIIDSEMEVIGDRNLLGLVLQNLLGNAFKFTSEAPSACIEFGFNQLNGEIVYFVRDNGAGFDMQYVDKLFKPFQRLHNDKDYPGTGIGLATVQRIIQRHGGRIWAEAEVSKGATFYFTLGKEKQ